MVGWFCSDAKPLSWRPSVQDKLGPCTNNFLPLGTDWYHGQNNQFSIWISWICWGIQFSSSALQLEAAGLCNCPLQITSELLEGLYQTGKVVGVENVARHEEGSDKMKNIPRSSCRQSFTLAHATWIELIFQLAFSSRLWGCTFVWQYFNRRFFGLVSFHCFQLISVLLRQ